MKVINIEWIYDDFEYSDPGFTELELPEGMTDEDEIIDYLTTPGYDVCGFDLVES